MSIPKHEPQGALLATRLKEEIHRAWNIQIAQTFMWSDCRTVLQWLHIGDKEPILVANRVGEILESATVDEWYHVATGDDPADTGTAEALCENCWVKRPRFFKTAVWPFQPSLEVVRKIRRKESAADVVGVSLILSESDTAVDNAIINWEKSAFFLNSCA